MHTVLWHDRVEPYDLMPRQCKLGHGIGICVGVWKGNARRVHKVLADDRCGVCNRGALSFFPFVERRHYEIVWCRFHEQSSYPGLLVNVIISWESASVETSGNQVTP